MEPELREALRSFIVMLTELVENGKVEFLFTGEDWYGDDDYRLTIGDHAYVSLKDRKNYKAQLRIRAVHWVPNTGEHSNAMWHITGDLVNILLLTVKRKLGRDLTLTFSGLPYFSDDVDSSYTDSVKRDRVNLVNNAIANLRS